MQPPATAGRREVDIRRWGPAMWDVLYATAFAYPDNPTPAEQAAARDFFHSLQLILPCTHCRDHFAAFLRRRPVGTASSADLTAWVLALNNDVNGRTGKPPVSLEAVWEGLQDHRHRRRCSALLVWVVGLAILFVCLLARCLW